MQRPLSPSRFLLSALLAITALACGGGGSGGGSPTAPAPVPMDDGGGDGDAFTFTEIEAMFFSTTCAAAGCHSAASAQEGLVLELGVAYDNTVDVPSSQQPGLDRIEPGDAESSYLIKKLRGDADITGERMPQGLAPLSQSDIDRIIAWVNAGAPRN